MTNKPIDIKDIVFQPMNEETKASVENHNKKLLRGAFINRLIVSAYVAVFVAIFQSIAQIIADKSVVNTIIICGILFALFNIVSYVFYLSKSKLIEFSEEAYTLDITITRLLGERQLQEEEDAMYEEHLADWKKNHLREKREYRAKLEEWQKRQNELDKQIKEMKKNTPYEEEFVLPDDFPKNPKPVYNVTPKPVYKKRRGYNDSVRIPEYVFFKCDQGDCTSAINIDDHDLFVKLKVGDKVRLLKREVLDRTSFEIIPLK